MTDTLEKTWIIAADGAKANIFKYEGPHSDLRLIDHLEHVNKKTGELVTDDRGRMNDRGPSQHSALEQQTDPQTHEKEVFAKEIASYLKYKVTQYDRLVVVAAPKTLGDLRKEFEKPVQQKITDELNKDLTPFSGHELPDHLGEVLYFEPNSITDTRAYAKYA